MAESENKKVPSEKDPEKEKMGSTEVALMLVRRFLVYILGLPNPYIGDSETSRMSLALLNKLAQYETQNASLADAVKRLETELSALRSQVQPNVPPEEQAALIDAIRQRIAQAADESFLTDLQIKAAELFQKNLFEQNVIRTFEEARRRLTQELNALGRRGNLNLFLGMLTTGVGLYFLYTFVINSPEPPKDLDWAQFGAHFIPRLTLVIFIEVFAYFFLRLYRTGLDEIKYYQNELTNLESKHIALVSAIEQKNPEVITEVIRKLATTERNRILSKTQTAVELEAAKLDKGGLAELAKQLAETVQILLPKKGD